jgi:hypothetical protein
MTRRQKAEIAATAICISIIAATCAMAQLPFGLDPLGTLGWTPKRLDPVAWWKFDDLAGAQAVESVSGLTAILSGATAPTPVSGRIGGAFQINGGDGVRGGVTPGDNDVFSFAAGGNDLPFSLSAWVFFQGNGYNPIVTKSDYGTNRREYLLYCSEARGFKITFVLMTTGSFNNRIGRSVSSALSTNAWHHVCVSYAGTKLESGISIYANGVRVDDLTYSAGTYTGMTNTTTKLGIGNDWNNDSPGNSLRGIIDDVIIWPRALTADEIKELYTRSLQREGAPWRALE